MGSPPVFNPLDPHLPPVPFTFITPPPSLTLAERVQKAIAEFDAILECELNACYQPMWKGLQAIVS